VIRATDREANVVKLRLIAVGKIREPYVARACDDFRARLRRHESFDEIEVAASHGGDSERAMREEGDRILKLIVASEPLWLLEREGDSFASVELAERLQTLADAGTSRLTIVVAGTYGASPALLARADVAWSLSRLTFLHEWARAIVLEQLYRASKIARNEPYHH
jgi:23S rRNA (pseudouridine1915-N3)-methyltransferase